MQNYLQLTEVQYSVSSGCINRVFVQTVSTVLSILIQVQIQDCIAKDTNISTGYMRVGIITHNEKQNNTVSHSTSIQNTMK